MPRGYVLQFVHDGMPGTVSIAVAPDDDPMKVGKDEKARGFPMCTATIDYPGEGYHRLMGWIQLVRSTDNTSGGDDFEMDPARFFEDSPAPFCFYGFAPTLFDAPSRDDWQPLIWLAHTFLAVVPRREDTAPRKALPLLGFSWGFDIDDGEQLTIAPVQPLSAADWNRHVAYLRANYPTWQFAMAERLP